MYKVVKFFTDLKDNNFAYAVGDTYPRQGAEVDDSRLAELASSANMQGVPLIEKVIEEQPKKKGKRRDADGDMSISE